MPRVTLAGLGRVGIVRDVPAHLLPPEVWSDGRNVRFRNEQVERLPGHRTVYDPPTVAPHWAMDVRSAAGQFWVYASLTKLYTVTPSGTHTDVTRVSGGDYGATVEDLWNGGIFGGVPIVNNGVDDPQYQSSVGAGTAFEALANWPANTKAEIIRPFKNFLFALNVTKSGTTFPHMVKWSDSADPGTVPGSWDETDTTLDAGEFDLTDVQSGIIREGLGLRDIFVVYKDHATWGLQFTGDQFIFRNFPILTTSGILSKHCVSVLPAGTQHFVATGEDLIAHDGQQAVSVLDKKVRAFVYRVMDTDNFDRSFTAVDVRNDEALFAFPEAGSTWPSLGVLWNYRENTVSLRELSDISFAVQGIIDEQASGVTWDGDSVTWEGKTNVWDDESVNPQSRGMLLCDPVNTKLYEGNRTNQFNGVNATAYVERTGLAIVGQSRTGEPVVDIGSRKMVTRVWINAKGDPFTVAMGGQEQGDGAITWETAKTFTPGTDTFVDFCTSGRYLAIRFASTGDVSWSIQGYDLEVHVTSKL